MKRIIFVPRTVDVSPQNKETWFKAFHTELQQSTRPCCMPGTCHLEQSGITPNTLTPPQIHPNVLAASFRCESNAGHFSWHHWWDSSGGLTCNRRVPRLIVARGDLGAGSATIQTIKECWWSRDTSRKAGALYLDLKCTCEVLIHST